MTLPTILTSPSCLIVAIGNDGRQDDGLGWAFGQAMEAEDAFRGTVAYRYQLQVEDALMVADYPSVVFVDACREKLPKGFDCTPLQATEDFSFTTHQLSPATVLAIAEKLYGANPQAYLLKISGVEWALEKGLSSSAAGYLALAVRAFSKI